MNKIILKGQERSLTIRLYLRSTENNHLLEHPPSLTLDSAKTMESVTPDYRTPECGIRYLLFVRANILLLLVC